MIKAIISVLVIITALLVAGLIGEQVAYRRYGSKLENANRQIHSGMSTEDVKRLVGEPDWKMEQGGEENWQWSATYRQGYLWKLLSLTTVKGHYDLSVKFNGQGRVIGIWGGVN